MGEYFPVRSAIRVATLIQFILHAKFCEIWIRVATLIDFSEISIRVTTLIDFREMLIRTAFFLD